MTNIYNFEDFNSFDFFMTIELIFISLLLLALGSFSSSLIFRLSPNFYKFEKNIFTSRSFCPKCKSSLSPLELIPIVSYLFQFAKCRSCKSKISFLKPKLASKLKIDFCEFADLILRNFFMTALNVEL